jgi:hypothetical protein
LAALLVVVVTSVAVYTLGFQTPPGPRSLRAFAPDRVASLEREMWEAYYRKQKLRLFSLLVVTLREQYRYTWARAAQAGFHLARAAAWFGDARGDYERVVPDLQAAYTIARDWSSSDFDPAEVARAELDWWVARRDPERRSLANVGTLIAQEYALLYSVPRERVAEAGRLRAEAGALRDAGAAQPDWAEVERLLRESYRSLRTATN